MLCVSLLLVARAARADQRVRFVRHVPNSRTSANTATATATATPAAPAAAPSSQAGSPPPAPTASLASAQQSPQPVAPQHAVSSAQTATAALAPTSAAATASSLLPPAGLAALMPQLASSGSLLGARMVPGVSTGMAGPPHNMVGARFGVVSNVAAPGLATQPQMRMQTQVPMQVPTPTSMGIHGAGSTTQARSLAVTSAAVSSAASTSAANASTMVPSQRVGWHGVGTAGDVPVSSAAVGGPRTQVGLPAVLPHGFLLSGGRSGCSRQGRGWCHGG